MTARASRAATVAGGFLSALDAELDAIANVAWPNPAWACDPVGFTWHILGIEPWGWQCDALESVRDNRHTAVSGGRKVGKDAVGGYAGLWWYASFDGARTMCFGPTMRQIDEILYREIRGLWVGHGRCVKCKRDNPSGPRPCPHSALMTGKMGLSAATGIEAPDLRQVVGMTAAGEGGVIGMSGRILAIEDEAAHMKDEIDTAIVGNLAGENTRRLLISNPVRTRGFFFRAFHTERDMYAGAKGSALFQVSSESSPNVLEGRTVIPGLASREWLAERERAWGRGSPMWLWHVEGKFLKAEAGQLFSIEAVSEAEARLVSAEAVGRLQIGIDVAGEAESGDETAHATRRGNRQLDLHAQRAMTTDECLAYALDMIRVHGRKTDVGDDRPIVVVDRDGAEGARVYNAFQGYLANHDGAFELVGFRGSERPKGLMGQTYKLNRDLAAGSLVAWLRDGGAILIDLMLEAELIELRWVDVEGGKQILIPKSELRERLDRSPDRYDAVALSVWREVRPFKTADGEGANRRPATRATVEDAGGPFDPFSEVDAAPSDRTFDPYR